MEGLQVALHVQLIWLCSAQVSSLYLTYTAVNLVQIYGKDIPYPTFQGW